MAAEKKGLGQFVKSQAKYGSTTKTKRSTEKYITHKIKPGDTLQGLALKYEIPMQDLKRANKMWTNDSLHLRETLLIPVTGTKSDGVNGEPTAHLSSNGSTPNGDINRKTDNSANATADSDNDASNITAQDFLNRFDSTLAQLKTNVQKLEDRKSMFEDETNPLHHLPQRRTKMGSRQRPPSLESDPMAVPETVITRPRAKTKQLENSSELFEKKHDEFFEL